MEKKPESRFLKNEFRSKKLTLLFLVNVSLILLAGVMMLFLSRRVIRAERTEKTKEYFAAIDSLKVLSDHYFESELQIVDDWIAFIRKSGLGVEETLSFASGVNSRDDRYVHLLNLSDYRAQTPLKTYDKAGGPRTGDVSVYLNVLNKSDSSWKERAEILEKMTDYEENAPVILSRYWEEIRQKFVISLGKPVDLADKNGIVSKYLLLRVIPVENLREELNFPTGFETAAISLIDRHGQYVVQSQSFPGKSFAEFIKANNFRNDPGASGSFDEILLSKKSASFICMNSSGENCCFYYVPLKDNPDLLLIGMIPLSDLYPASNHWKTILCISLFFILVVGINTLLVRNMYQKLKKSAVEANQANEAKTRFLSSMSHDIRTPMNAIIGMTDLAEKHRNDRKYVDDCLEKIRHAGNHLLTLVNDILDISAVESGRMTLNPSSFLLSNLAANLAAIVKPQVMEKKLNFQIHAHDVDEDCLFADELRLNQIFLNLLSNAIKYTPEGGHICVSFYEKPSEQSPKNVLLTFVVEDDGIGMTREFQKNMYEAFSRQTDTRVNTVQGAGLGLAITKQMVNLLGGTIECESAENAGTKFTVSVDLPVGDAEKTDLDNLASRILLVDDDVIFLKTTKSMLEGLGVSVDCATSGEESVKMVSDSLESGKTYDLVIMDLYLPVIDGMEATRAIHALCGDKAPRIVLSSYNLSDVQESARKSGVNGFLAKPVFKSNLRTLLNNLQSEGRRKNKDFLPEYDLSALKVLVAEDNELNWIIIRELLNEFSIESVRAANGQQCLEILAENSGKPFDLVLMDVQMPVMNGKEATRSIRANPDPAINSLPVVALTADAFVEDVQACFECGMNAHLAKPIDPKKLVENLYRFGVEKNPLQV
ncbi:MAG: response regulator [Treponemataceae bacterium]|nr:response regulator [Treponemataceae bacterium]